MKDGDRYLVTTDNWFHAPDGQSYRAAWGRIRVLKTKDILGFDPARPSTNWFLKVGIEKKHILIGGCQIHYLVRSEIKPKSAFIGVKYKDKDTGVQYSAERIYFAE
jgi:hypothetical protein